MEHIVIQNGSLEGDEPIILVKNSNVYNDDKQPCPHCHSPIKVVNTRSDLSTWEDIRWVNPFEALIPYDGDCCHTGICLKCLLDGISKNNLDIKYIKEQVIKDFENIPVYTAIETVLLKKQGWVGHKGCIWTKGKNRLAYEEDENDELNWNLNGTSVEFMEEITI